MRKERSCCSAAAMVITLAIAVPFLSGHSPAALTLPASQQEFVFDPVTSPVVADDPATTRPIGLGPVAAEGGTLTLHIQTGLFSSGVDVYLLLSFPAIDPTDIYLVREDYTVTPLTAGISPWKRGVTGVDETPFGTDVPVESLPEGDYLLGLLVTPEGDGSFTRFHLWITGFTKHGSENPAGFWIGRWFSRFGQLNPGQQRPGSTSGDAVMNIGRTGALLTGFVDLIGTTPPLERIPVNGEITTGRPDLSPPCTDFEMTGRYANGSQLLISGCVGDDTIDGLYTIAGSGSFPPDTGVVILLRR